MVEVKEKFSRYVNIGWFYSIGYDSLGYNVRVWKALPYTSQWAQSKKRKMITEVGSNFDLLVDKVINRIEYTELYDDYTT